MAKKKVEKNENGLGKVLLGASLVAAAGASYFLFGPDGQKNRKKVKMWFLKAKIEVLEKIEKIDEISEDKYHEVVNAVVKKYEKTKDWTEKETEELKKEAKKHWKNIEKEFKSKEKEVGNKINKARKIIAKKIDPKKESAK